MNSPLESTVLFQIGPVPITQAIVTTWAIMAILVIGAFALTQNLFLIAIGLGIGAMYVRSMTIMLVEKGTLSEFRFLEHGAFYSILALSVIMFSQSLVSVPEVVTGLIGAAIIGLSLTASIRERAAHADG